jgi:purine catabolism regulator
VMSPESRITVLDIWQVALPAGTLLLGGKEGLGQPVEWVASLRTSFPLFGTLDKGYIALARLELARRLDGSITPSYLLNELHRARAAALVVDSGISAEDAALADALSLPVLLLPNYGQQVGWDLHEVERSILRTLVDREAQLTRRETEARHQLQQLFSRGGMAGVLAELARLTGGAVSIRDIGGRPLGQAGVGIGDENASDTTLPIAVAGVPLGLLALRRRACKHDPMDLIYARQAADICAIEMLQRRTRQEAEERLGADLVEMLLDEDQHEDAIVARFARLDYSLSPGQRHIVIALGSGSADDTTACQNLVRDLEWNGERCSVTIISTVYRRHVLAFCALDASVSEGRMRNWLQETIRNQSHCTAGVSRIVKDVAGLRTAVYQAIDAWNLGQRIEGRASPHFYEELGLYRLLTGIRARDELKRFYEETLGALTRYDATHGTDLVHTLQVFFEQNANASQTSRALFVHRNTLNYRLQRIMEISGLDLNDAEARLALQLAIKVHQLAQS